MLQKSYGMHVFSFFFGHITERMYSDAMFYVENEKKRSEETQTLRAGCSKTEPKISPRRRPPSRGRGTPKI